MTIALGPVVAALAMFAAVPAQAASGQSGVVGNYALADLGQGAWAGGPLYANGTLGGGGSFSFANGQEVGVITGGTWSPDGPSAVDFCANVRWIKNPFGLPATQCLTGVPATGQPTVIDGTLVKVTLRS